MTVKQTINFRNVTPFSLGDWYQSLGETSCLRIRGIWGSHFLQNVSTYLGNTKWIKSQKTVIFQVTTDLKTRFPLQAGQRLVTAPSVWPDKFRSPPKSEGPPRVLSLGTERPESEADYWTVNIKCFRYRMLGVSSSRLLSVFTSRY
jgi:hypothetical protein